MLRNYLLIAWRSIRKHKAFTAINVAGLALSMSVCLLLILLIYDHLSYDTFHPHVDRTYRITSYQEGSRNLLTGGFASSPLPLGNTLRTDYAGVEAVAQMNHSFRGEIRSAQKVLDLGRSLWADEHFFTVFGFTLLEGDPATALREPHSVVVTEDFGKKLFPDGKMMGQTVEVADWGSFVVTGVLRTPPGKSHIDFYALGSMRTLPALAANDKYAADFAEWPNLWMNYNYLLLSDPSVAPGLVTAMNKLGDEFLPATEDRPLYRFDLQNIGEVVPGPTMNNEIKFTLPAFVLMCFGFLGLIVIITATINYANLSIARSISRAREVGIRKVNGATRWQIVSQFLVESVFIALLALGLAIGIYKLLIDEFNSLWIFNLIGIQLTDSPLAYVFFLGFSLVLGLLTGVGPSLFISRLSTVRSLKGSLETPTLRRGWSSYFSGKKMLLGIQFGLSFIMLVSIFLLRDQASLLTRSDYGFADDQVFFVELQSHDPELIKTTFSQIPGVSAVSYTSHHPGVGEAHGDSFRRNPEDEDLSVYHFSVDENYVEVMGLQLIAGQDFPPHSSTATEKFILLNRLATERLGFANPEEAVGTTLLADDDRQLRVMGVVENYHWEPLMKAISPLALRVQPDQYRFAYFHVNGANPAALQSRFRETWEAFDGAREFKGGFLNEEMDTFFTFLYDISAILTLISVIAISITLLGFLGMVSFHLKTHVKEIGIRRVLGAGFALLTLSMSRGFVITLTITAMVAVPLALLLNQLWINVMATRIAISVWNVAPPVLIILGLVVVTIVSQVWKSTNTNPVDSLRNE